MDKNGSIRLTVVDWLMILFTIVLATGTLNPGQQGGICAVVHYEPFLMAYWLVRIMYFISRKWTDILLLASMCCFCTYELFLGYIQLLGNNGAGRGQDICVGSFTNSGPLGCFLAVCSALCVSIYLKVRNRIIRTVSVVLGALSVILMSCTLSRASVLAFAVSMLLLALKRERARAFMRRWGAVTCIGVILLGIGAYLIKKPSADGRLFMTRICLRMIRNNGLAGLGLGNYAAAYGREQALFFAEYADKGPGNLDIESLPDNLCRIADCPTFAFNEYLRLGIEAGPAAMVLLAGLMVCGVAALYRSNSIWCSALVCLTVFACFSYPFEVGTLTLIAVVCLAAAGGGVRSSRNNITAFSLLLLVLGTVFYGNQARIKSTGMIKESYGMERLCGNRHKLYYVQGCTVIPDDLYDEHFLFALGQSFNKSGDYAESDSVLMLGASVSSDPMFWNVMGNNSLAQGKYDEAEERYRHAFFMVPNRLYPLCLLAKVYLEQGDTARFSDIACRIDTFIPKVESVNTARLRTEIKELHNNLITPQN